MAEVILVILFFAPIFSVFMYAAITDDPQRLEHKTDSTTNQPCVIQEATKKTNEPRRLGYTDRDDEPWSDWGNDGSWWGGCGGDHDGGDDCDWGSDD